MSYQSKHTSEIETPHRNQDIDFLKDTRGHNKAIVGRKGKENKRKREVIQNVSRLVAQRLIPYPFNLPTVNHKNPQLADNRVENLEWAIYHSTTSV